jgi:DNA-binding response OmpR family regulator
MWLNMAISPHKVIDLAATKRPSAPISYQQKTGSSYAHSSSRRILCVEDDEDTRSMIISLLGLIGCDVIPSENVPEAVSQIKGENFELYLLDNWLPGGSGLELCKKIRASDSSTPIIFYSGGAYQSDKEAALKAGAQAYLIKPNDTGILVATVRALLDMKNACCHPWEISPGFRCEKAS